MQERWNWQIRLKAIRWISAPFASKATIDACRPFDFLHEFPAVAEASKDLQQKVRAKWQHILG
jgi:hypothetical protein